MEIERTFLLGGLPDELPAASSAVLRRGYLPTSADGQARLRDADGACTLTGDSRRSNASLAQNGTPDCAAAVGDGFSLS